jgi:pimeloyl-ACP methyl ester carboxylesterase
MPEFESEGLRLHYELVGPDDGVPTVLLHGFASDYELNWVGSRWQETLVNAGRLVVGLDQRGHGRSAKPHDPALYKQDTLAADAFRLLDHLGIREADFVGYSMGAYVGLRGAVLEPGRFGRLVLGGLGTLGGFREAEAIARIMRGDSAVRNAIAESFYRFAAARDINDLEALAACILGEPATFSKDALAQVNNPILIVVGERDQLVIGAREFAQDLPNARYLELAGRDHMNAVPAKQFKEAALAFLEGAHPA